MPPPVILPPAELDLAQIIADRDEIMRFNPQRHEFQLLDAVFYQDIERGIIAGFHDIRDDAFWVRGHIPGRPIFPGVLMIESAAQLCSYMYSRVVGPSGFLGFAGVDGVKFRGAVTPPSRFVIIGQAKSIKVRRMICYMQGFVGDEMVFEAEITGMPI
jgi:3-hydroxyacyl-[acyl-carrier-protein] dehydratase